ncbi:MAG: hypothetical protein HY719_03550 [Planctomycetes bacterium]|nr:hypothetical protein [Planctomycetota bacterium]
MTDFATPLANEVRRLKMGPAREEPLGGVGSVRFIAKCPAGTNGILDRVCSVLLTVDQIALSGEFSGQDWTDRLPAWFVAACAPDRKVEEVESWMARWRRLPREEQVQVQKEYRWSLESWLYWFQPENRYWFWWDAEDMPQADLIVVAVEVHEWPFPWGALRWLFKAAGASDLVAEE